jgi:tetratricopeptide (TPR) repeat protein
MGRYEEALVGFDRAIALDNTIIPSWPGERGLLLSYMGRYDEVIAVCDRGLKDNPHDYITLYTLAAVKARLKGMVAAQADIETTRNVLQAVNDPKQQLAFEKEPDALMTAAGLSESERSAIKNRNSAQITAICADEHFQAAVVVALPNPDPLPDPDPPLPSPPPAPPTPPDSPDSLTPDRSL